MPQDPKEIGFAEESEYPQLMRGPVHLQSFIGRPMKQIHFWQLLATRPTDTKSFGRIKIDESLLLGRLIDPDTRGDMMDAATEERSGRVVPTKDRRIWFLGDGSWRIVCVTEGREIVAFAETNYNEVEALAQGVFAERLEVKRQMTEAGQAYHEMR